MVDKKLTTKNSKSDDLKKFIVSRIGHGLHTLAIYTCIFLTENFFHTLSTVHVWDMILCKLYAYIVCSLKLKQIHILQTFLVGKQSYNISNWNWQFNICLHHILIEITFNSEKRKNMENIYVESKSIKSKYIDWKVQKWREVGESVLE